MTIHARIKNGQVVLPIPLDLPDGTPVTVAPVTNGDTQEDASDTAPKLHERMKSVIGIAKDMPDDSSRNVDCYLYG